MLLRHRMLPQEAIGVAQFRQQIRGLHVIRTA